MIYGFVQINSPEKMMGASINNAVEEIIHEEIDTNEINDDDFDLANNITEKIANGSISPRDQHHYEVALLTIQKRGIKGKYLNFTESNFL